MSDLDFFFFLAIEKKKEHHNQANPTLTSDQCYIQLIINIMSAQSMFPGLTASRFTRQITRLNLISSGPGSVTVGQNVKNVELLFKRLNTDGHMGAR